MAAELEFAVAVGFEMAVEMVVQKPGPGVLGVPSFAVGVVPGAVHAARAVRDAAGVVPGVTIVVVGPSPCPEVGAFGPSPFAVMGVVFELLVLRGPPASVSVSG